MINRIAKVIFPASEKVCSDISLYFKDTGGVEYLADSLFFKKNSRMSLFTYFNAISYSKLKSYTEISKIIFSFSLVGSAVVTIKCAEVEMDANRRNYEDIYKSLSKANYIVKKLKEEKFYSSIKEDKELVFDISALQGEGLVYAEVAGEEGTILTGCEYLAFDPLRRDCKIGVVFCTYKREEFVRENVRRINNRLNNDAALKNKIKVFVIDNGQTLKEDELEGAYLFPNSNTGGSGGFTRGIMEVAARKEYTHFLLMDDDIKFETEILSRILFWIQNAIDPERLTVGGTMLIAEKPNFQYEMGARWTGNSVTANKYGYNIRKPSDIVRNEYELPCDYNAWWCCCMPVSTVNRIGLPLQMFIKADDVEYSLRAKNNIIVTNGIGVWHESFASKYSSELEYYIKRNELIVNAIHNPSHGPISEIHKMIRSISRQLIYHRYEPIRQIFMAYDHFLKGAKFFDKIDAEIMHKKLREGMIKQYTKEELKVMGYDILNKTVYKTVKNSPSYRLQVITLNGYLIPRHRYPKSELNSFRLIEMNESKPKAMYKANTVVQYNHIAGKGFVTHLKKGELIFAGLGLLVRSFRLFFCYKHISKGYKKLIESPKSQSY